MTAKTYTTQKLSASRVAIFCNDEYLCQLRPNEVKVWIARAIDSDKRDAEYAIIQREYRIAAAKEYLAKRAIRQSATESQLSLF